MSSDDFQSRVKFRPAMGIDPLGRGLAAGDSFGLGGRLAGGLPDDPPISPGGTSGIPATEEDLIKNIILTYNHEYEIRKPHEVQWDRCWKRVQNRYDASRKARWQSQKNFPAVLITFLKMVWEQTKPMEMAGDKWFECETDEPDWQPLLDIPRDLVLEFMNGSGSDPNNNFLSVWHTASCWGHITGQVAIRAVAEEDGFIDMSDSQDQASMEQIQGQMGLISSIPSLGFGSPGGGAGDDELDPGSGVPPQLPGKKGWRIQYEALNPRFLFKDTASRRSPRYIIQTQTMTRGEFREEATARGWQHIEEVCSENTGTGNKSMYAERNKSQLEKDLARDPKRLDQVFLMHYYGMVYGPTGEKLLDEPSYLVVANDRYITCPAQSLSAYWHGCIPIILGGILKLPGNPYYKSLLEVNLDPQELRVELTNMIVDYLNQTINPPTEVDVDQLNNVKPHQLASGIFPGKLLEVQKSNNPGPAVSRSAMPDMPSGVWQGLGLINQSIIDFTGMADSPNMPRTRTRMSNQEIRERQAASGGVNQQIAKDLEREVLEPLVWQSYLLGLQKYPQDLWKAFILRKISELKNRTRSIPPGAGGTPPPPIPVPPPTAGKQPQRAPEPPPGAPQPPQAPAPVPGGTPGQPPPPESEDPDLEAKLQEMLNWTPRERFVKLGSQFRFRVKIFTALESRREDIERYAQLTQMAEATPMLAARIKWHNVGEKIVRALDMDPEQVLWPNAGATAEAMQAPSKDMMAPRPVQLSAPTPPSMPPPSGY